MVNCAVILLAAGKSTRMGCLKALLPWNGTTLLQHQISQLQQSKAEQLIVVVGSQSGKLLPCLKGLSIQVVYNEDFEKGKTESIKRGILAINENTDCLIIAAVDQPVNQPLIDEMIEQYIQTNSKIIIPVYNEKRGHPILFSIEILEEILEINEETLGLKALIKKRTNDIYEMSTQDPSILFNFNSPKDYQKSSNEEEHC